MSRIESKSKMDEGIQIEVVSVGLIGQENHGLHVCMALVKEM